MTVQTTKPNRTFNNQRWWNKICLDKVKFKQCWSTNPALEKVLEGKLQSKTVKQPHKSTGNKQSQISKTKEMEVGMCIYAWTHICVCVYTCVCAHRRACTNTHTHTFSLKTSTTNNIMEISIHWLLISLKIIGLNSQTKRYRLTNGYYIGFILPHPRNTSA